MAKVKYANVLKKAKLRMPKTVTYQGRRYNVLAHYVSQGIALSEADRLNGRAVWIPRYDPYYLVVTR